MHHAQTQRDAFPAARFTVGSSASASLPADLRDLAAQAPRTPWAPCTCTRTPVAADGAASPVAAGYGCTAGEQGSGHLRTVRRTAVFSRDELRPESNRANCLFHQCRSYYSFAWGTVLDSWNHVT